MKGEAFGNDLSTPGGCSHIKIAESGNAEIFGHGVG